LTGPLFRVYDEVGQDGYPPEWHETIKHAVRDECGHRCIRCLHPYTVNRDGNVTWTSGFQVQMNGAWINVSRCDDLCTHGEPTILLETDGSTVAPWRILTVHHLNGNKADCRWWNLAALCQRCHLRVQQVVLMERVWPWPHSDWFKPYAAGWYAHAYLGEDLTREQTVQRLDELLALERAA
jgi:hypothetical protein